jgi:hypothetical protein
MTEAMMEKFIRDFVAALRDEASRIWRMEDDNDAAISGALERVADAAELAIRALKEQHKEKP